MDNITRKYLEVLSEQYSNINSATTEIINLSAILNLPKGTEHFLSDIHGEYLAFNHVLKNASGVIKNYIEELFGNALMEAEKRNLAILIYYPEQRLERIKDTVTNLEDWYKITLFRLVTICKRVSSKYTRSKVRKVLNTDFSYIIQELIHEDFLGLHKQNYYAQIIDSIIRLNRAPDFIIAISNVIQRLAIDHLHVIGDIYDRGAYPDKVMDVLMAYHSVDIQWGNHDISWIGAASGSLPCICNVIRISCRYNNLHIIDEAYGINLIPLATFALDVYKDVTKVFMPEVGETNCKDSEVGLTARMHKAITIMQLKAEGQVILRNPDYKMDDRLLLSKMRKTEEGYAVEIDGTLVPLCDDNFPTIDLSDPYAFTDEEKDILEKICHSFKNSHRLQEHARFLLNKGSMYLKYNNNLLFHGCIPVNADGSLRTVEIDGVGYKGKALLDKADALVRHGYFSKDKKRLEGLDYQWYLWCGVDSPIFGKDRMATFERYFIEDEKFWHEIKDPYYSLRENIEMCENILIDFGLDPKTAHIINGHVPVNVLKGEEPVKAGGRMIVIDGGFSKAYYSVTGFAGYTLIYNSQGLLLASHQPFNSMRDAYENEVDIVSDVRYIEHKKQREYVGNTDIGNSLKERINDLEMLVKAYSKGEIKEKI